MQTPLILQLHLRMLSRLSCRDSALSAMTICSCASPRWSLCPRSSGLEAFSLLGGSLLRTQLGSASGAMRPVTVPPFFSRPCRLVAVPYRSSLLDLLVLFTLFPPTPRFRCSSLPMPPFSPTSDRDAASTGAPPTWGKPGSQTRKADSCVVLPPAPVPSLSLFLSFFADCSTLPLALRGQHRCCSRMPRR